MAIYICYIDQLSIFVLVFDRQCALVNVEIMIKNLINFLVVIFDSIHFIFQWNNYAKRTPSQGSIELWLIQKSCIFLVQLWQIAAFP